MTKLRLISATRQDANAFHRETLLGQSLKHPAHCELLLNVAFENRRGLPEVYNTALLQHQEELLLFCHDDLALPPTPLEPLIQQCLRHFDIVGLAGNRRDQGHVAWHVRPDGLGWDYPYLRGQSISGSTTNPTKNVRGLCDVPVALIDGAFIAVQRNRLLEQGVRFDEQFRFHFYDLDLCRQARKHELRLGVIRLDCLHQSGGAFGHPAWIDQAKLYCTKWNIPYPHKAIACFQTATNPQIIDAAPSGPPAFEEGRKAYRNREWSSAQRWFEEALTIEPDHPWSWLQKANCQRQRGETNQAIASLRQLCRSNPRFTDGWKNLGLLLQQANAFTEARDCLERLVALAPTHVEHVCSLSDLLIRMDSFEDAESLLRAAAHGFGQHQQASSIWLRLGMLLERNGDANRAIKALHNAALLDPHNPDVQLPYLALMLSIGQPEAALVRLNKLLEQHPDHVDGLQRKAEILQCIGQNEASLAVCRQARELDPERIDLQLMELYACHSLCDWSQRDQQLKALEIALQQRSEPGQPIHQPEPTALPPFGLLTLPLSTEIVTREIDRWVLTHRPHNGNEHKTPSIQRVHHGNGRLRIGYLSADYRTHAMGLLLEGLFDAHDPEQAEVFAYSISPIRDSLTDHYRSSADHFHDLSQTSDFQALKRIEADSLDVLIDLSGLTTFSRPTILGAHPVELQVGYLGFPGSQGHHLVDAILADRELIPQELEGNYCEDVLRLPSAWSTRFRQPKPGITRSSLGLPETGTLFCCFNRAEKITPTIAKTWMAILREVHGSWLWLALKPDALKRFQHFAQQQGVAPERLLIAPYQQPIERFIAAMACADLFLDTPDFNAGAIGALAINAALPVLTCAGEAFSARMGASICKAATLDALVMQDLTSYQNRAIELGHDHDRLQQLKQKLSATPNALPLFQQKNWVDNLCKMLRDKTINKID